MHEAGLLSTRQVEYALCRLKDAAMLSTKMGQRPGAPRPYGRILVPHLDSPVKVLVPTRDEMTALWLACAEIRARPAALVTLMVGAHIQAAHAVGGSPTSWTRLECSQAALRRFVGASKGSTFNRRIDALESLRLISRGNGMRVSPPRSWMAWKRAAHGA